jgi:uncharacterized membrane protein YkvA (DUF1232 family)
VPTLVLATIGVLLALWLILIVVVALAAHPRVARELVAFVPNLLRLFRDLIRDPRVPARAKAVVWLAVLWIASPIDPIPEFIPVIGQLDDALVAILALRYILRRTDPILVVQYWNGSPEALRVVMRLAGSGP